MEVQRQQFHQLVRPAHRPVDPGTRPFEHPAATVAEIQDQELGFAPLDADLAAMLHPLALRRLDLRADAHPPAIHLRHDVPAHQIVPRRELAVTIPLQLAGACGEDLGPQLAGHAVDRLLIERRASLSQFVVRQLDRGEQGGQSAHLRLQRRSGPLADAQGRQFGIVARPLLAPSFRGACLGSAVGRGDPDDQAAEQAEFQRARFGGASTAGGVGTPFFPGSAWSWVVVAWARRLAVI